MKGHAGANTFLEKIFGRNGTRADVLGAPPPNNTLMGLPRELRQLVYHHLWHEASDIFYVEGQWDVSASIVWKGTMPPISFVNRQVLFETLTVWLQKTKIIVDFFALSAPQSLHSFLATVPNYQAFRNVRELHFNGAILYDGFKRHRAYAYAVHAKNVISACTGLRVLVFDLRGTKAFHHRYEFDETVLYVRLSRDELEKRLDLSPIFSHPSLSRLHLECRRPVFENVFALFEGGFKRSKKSVKITHG